MRPSTPSPSSSPPKGSNAWFAKEAEEILPEGFACPHCGAKAGFDQGDRYPGRLVRLRLHPLRRHEAGPGLLARHHVSGGPGPVPRLVPVRAADRRGRLGPGRALQGVRHPRLDRGRRGQSHAQVPGQRHGPRRDHSTSTARTCCACGPAQRRLPRRRPLLSTRSSSSSARTTSSSATPPGTAWAIWTALTPTS